MGFEVYLQCFGETERSGISRSVVRSLFPIFEQGSEPNYWQVQYDAKNSCHIGVTALEGSQETLEALYVDRPCADPRLWAALFSILRMGSVVMFWPGGPPILAAGAAIAGLPQDMIDSLGKPKFVRSPEELFGTLRDS